MKILKVKKIDPILVHPEDIIHLYYGECHLITDKIKKSATFDTVMIVEVNNEFGLEWGIGGIFGRSCE